MQIFYNFKGLRFIYSAQTLLPHMNHSVTIYDMTATGHLFHPHQHQDATASVITRSRHQRQPLVLLSALDSPFGRCLLTPAWLFKTNGVRSSQRAFSGHFQPASINYVWLDFEMLLFTNAVVSFSVLSLLFLQFFFLHFFMFLCLQFIPTRAQFLHRCENFVFIHPLLWVKTCVYTPALSKDLCFETSFLSFLWVL